jgi:hypothetical protein
VITEYIDVLKPLKAATKRLEGRGKSGAFRAVAEIILVFEYLLRVYENCLQSYDDVIHNEHDEFLKTTSLLTSALPYLKPTITTTSSTYPQLTTLLQSFILAINITSTQCRQISLIGWRATTAIFKLCGLRTKSY